MTTSTTSVVRRLPAGFWIGLAIGLAMAAVLEWYFAAGPGAGSRDAGMAQGYWALLLGFPLLWVAGPLLQSLSLPSAVAGLPLLAAVLALNAAGWGAGLHLVARSVTRRVRALHAPPSRGRDAPSTVALTPTGRSCAVPSSVEIRSVQQLLASTASARELGAPCKTGPPLPSGTGTAIAADRFCKVLLGVGQTL